MVGLGAVPGIVQLASLTYLPESRECGCKKQVMLSEADISSDTAPAREG